MGVDLLKINFHDSQIATLSQRRYLRQLGYEGPWNLSFEKAKTLIDQLVRERKEKGYVDDWED